MNDCEIKTMLEENQKLKAAVAEKDEEITRLTKMLEGEIVETGYLKKTILRSLSENSTQWDFNTSAILSKLIKEAGRICEHHASDLFLSWQEIEKFLNSGMDAPDKAFTFAFRKSGVDNIEYKSFDYSAVWILKFETNEDENSATLRLYRKR